MALLVRRMTVLGALAGGAAGLWLAGAPGAIVTAAMDGSLWARPVDAQIAHLSAVAGWLCLTWLVAAAVASALVRLPGTAGRVAGAVARRIAPLLVRRAIEAALGMAVATSSVAIVCTPALALSTTSRPASTAAASRQKPQRPAAPGAQLWTATAQRSAIGDRVPSEPDSVFPFGAFDRPVGAPSRRPGSEDPPPRPRPAGVTVPLATLGRSRSGPASSAVGPGERVAAPSGQGFAGEDMVVVLRGDSLWSIASAALGPDADDAAIDAEWRRWYGANRARIGPDPDLIRPGQRLAPPPSR